MHSLRRVSDILCAGWQKEAHVAVHARGLLTHLTHLTLTHPTHSLTALTHFNTRFLPLSLSKLKHIHTRAHTHTTHTHTHTLAHIAAAHQPLFEFALDRLVQYLRMGRGEGRG